MGNLVSISDSSTLIGADQPATIRAPEIEAGVGCDFDSYLLVPDNALDDRIAAAKARLGQDVVIMGHHYQRDEVVKFADFRGDSLKLSFQASQAEGRYIVFCGVHFMAESADILRREHQTVILPDLNAGCSMADMADIGQVEACWSELCSLLDSRKIIPVTYMNSTAAIKAFTGEHGGSVCTSSNAAGVMHWAFETGEKVLFLPDEHLGRNTGYRMGIPLEQMIVWDPYQEFGGNTPGAIRSARIILWKGYCSVHHRFTPQQATAGPQRHLARSQRLCWHNDVPHYCATSPLGARKSWRGQRRQSHLRRRTRSPPCASCSRPHAKFALASVGGTSVCPLIGP